MTARKYQDLYRNSGAQSSAKKPDKKPSKDEDKLVINQLLDLISKKIKDPNFAKKAALIIENMIQQKPKK